MNIKTLKNNISQEELDKINNFFLSLLESWEDSNLTVDDCWESYLSYCIDHKEQDYGILHLDECRWVEVVIGNPMWEKACLDKFFSVKEEELYPITKNGKIVKVGGLRVGDEIEGLIVNKKIPELLDELEGEVIKMDVTGYLAVAEMDDGGNIVLGVDESGEWVVSDVVYREDK